MPMIFIDTHVHFHTCFELGSFLHAAANNFFLATERFPIEHRYQSVLCLADTADNAGFNSLLRLADSQLDADGWSLNETDEHHSLTASHQLLGSLTILAGRQIRCKEGIELLALCSNGSFSDGMDLQAAFELAKSQGAVPVLPWGFGKWTGRRGKVVRQFIENQTPERLSLGDNGGRPGFWPDPVEFGRARSAGFRILPGSDSLPFPSEVKRVASCGLAVTGTLNEAQPARDVIRVLSDPAIPFQSFVQLEKPLRFLRNQLAMQLVKWKRAEPH